MSQPEVALPSQIGRYRISGVLGTGGFGIVLRANDESLGRDVAIKIPRRVASGAAGDSLEDRMSEARIVARLDHPHIVPVFDVGSTEEIPFFVVSKYIAGTDLRGRLDKEKPTQTQTVRWIADIADALQHAHEHGLVHRDVKPSNVLIDEAEHPWLTDFGLALQETDTGKGGDKKYVGTFSYMSPEQARGEGHLVDGRADIFSLGIVLYEMLVGIRPFQGSSSRQLISNIVRAEPRPLRQRDPELSVELERICSRALAKRVSDRYPSAVDMASDLRRIVGSVQEPGQDQSTPLHAVPEDSKDPTVIPKGLRAFDEHDHSFFLKLVPGARDAQGVPETIRQLKQRIDANTASGSFRVGLIYGASGSGKSSLLRAGVAPLLGKGVHVTYVEATSNDTEARLIQSLPKPPIVSGRPNVSESDDLVALMTAIRRRPAEQEKIVIVLDQFEQWLHSHHDVDNSELVNALRQCDGVALQCVVLIRDDFWMQATRFFHDLDIRLTQDVNSFAVDRFESRHARYVLAEFGRAYGCLPEDLSQLGPEQSGFLDQVISGLEEDGKIIPIHLVLLAQMLKGQDWTPDSLAQFGGTEGVGINFLDAAFVDETASPLHRSLQSPARAVLAALLPEAGSDIKGQMKVAAELREIASLDERGFEELLGVLDGELRLITPTASASDAPSGSVTGYQLTHDFLVPSLREWLTRKDRETARGRAKLKMKELSQYWKHTHQRRFLPDVVEYSQMAVLTKASGRTVSERDMMTAAKRYHGIRWGLVTVLAMFVVGVGWAIQAQINQRLLQRQADSVVKQLLSARIDEVPQAIASLQSLHSQAAPLLMATLSSDSTTEAEKLRARLALVDQDPDTQVRPLIDLIAVPSAEELVIIQDRLKPHADRAIPVLWDVVNSNEVDELPWLKAAYLLAALDPDNPRWAVHSNRLVNAVVNQNPRSVTQLAGGFAHLSDVIVDPMRRVYEDSELSYAERDNAAVVLAECVGDRPSLLVDLVVDATPTQFELLFPLLDSDRERVVPLLRKELSQRADTPWPSQSESMPTMDDSLVAEIELAHGLISNAFAVFQDLPLAQFDNVAGLLDALGYSPQSVRVYRRRGESHVSSAWRRDAKQWEFTRHATKEDAEQQMKRMRSRRLYPLDVTAIPRDSGDSKQSYGVLWGELDESVIDSRIYVGASEVDHSDAWGPLNDAGFLPKSNLKLRMPDGTYAYSSVRWKSLVNPRYEDAWDDERSLFETRILDGWHHADIRLNSPDDFGGNSNCAAVWWNGGPVESRAEAWIGLDAHVDRFRAYAGEGFRPECVSVVEEDGVLLAASIWHRPVVSEREKDRLASRIANASIALFRLGEPETLWPSLRHSPDPRIRSFLVDRFASHGVEPRMLVERLLQEDDESIRFAILAAIGQYRPEQLPMDVSEQLRDVVAAWGTMGASAAIHSISQYLCKKLRWDQTAAEIAEVKQPVEPALDSAVTWKRIGEGFTMVTIPGPIEFTLGSPGHEPFRDHEKEATRRCRIPRRYAISTTEVTVAQYQRFDPSFSYAGDYTTSEVCPANMISWFDAVAYCRWLSEQQGVSEDQMCYPDDDKITSGMMMDPGYLERTGYRLPTAAEWEYACRAGTTTTRYYGNSISLLGSYAWSVENSGSKLQPVASLIPNDFGLFDMLGNAMELAQDPEEFLSGVTKQVHVDVGESFGEFDYAARVARGSAYLYPPSSVRCANVEPGRAMRTNPYVGFRIARTVSSE